jgi:hypothetical protein
LKPAARNWVELMIIGSPTTCQHPVPGSTSQKWVQMHPHPHNAATDWPPEPDLH